MNDTELTEFLTALSDRVIATKKGINREEAIVLSQLETEAQILELCSHADRVRRELCGNVVDLCSISNIKSGNCSENCGFCSQSAHHPTPTTPIYGIKTSDEILNEAKQAAERGAKRFCLVSQGRGVKYNSPKSAEFQEILRTVRRITQEAGIKPCCALGEITLEQAQALKEAGVTRYNHNLESSENFYPTIVSTHSWHDRVQTVQNLKSVGIQACTGGIIGMGETWADRIDLALSLAELAVESVPINLLNPRAGTPLGHLPKLSPYEAAQTIAIFRLILPTQILRYAGGREAIMGDLQALGLQAGINAMLVGNYLTTLGQPASADHQLLSQLGLEGGEAPIPQQSS